MSRKHSRDRFFFINYRMNNKDYLGLGLREVKEHSETSHPPNAQRTRR